MFLRKRLLTGITRVAYESKSDWSGIRNKQTAEELVDQLIISYFLIRGVSNVQYKTKQAG